MRALEKEGWLKVLHPHWSSAKVDASGLAALLKTEQRMRELGYSVDAAPARMYFLTDKLSEREIGELQKLIPHKEFVAAWRNLEAEAKDLAKRLTGKDAATPSRTWDLLTRSRPEAILFLETTGKQQMALQKVRNFFGKWREVKQKLPLPEMVEMRITPELAEYPKIAEDVFRLMLDGKLRSHTELVKYLKPFSPPPPPPPPPPPARRGRARAEAAAAGAVKGALAAGAAKGGAAATVAAPATASAAKSAKKKGAGPAPQIASPAAAPAPVPAQKGAAPAKAGAKAAKPAPSAVLPAAAKPAAAKAASPATLKAAAPAKPAPPAVVKPAAKAPAPAPAAKTASRPAAPVAKKAEKKSAPAKKAAAAKKPAKPSTKAAKKRH
jgi:tRNA nucleotidyltransferase (CCA-adding enzyme)